MRSLSCAVFFLIHAAIASTQLEPILDSSTEAFVKNVLGQWKSPAGIAVAVVRQDATSETGWYVETTGYGFAKLDGSKNVTGNTLFSIASNSKLFTAIATGLLIHDSRVSPPLQWTSKMREVLPGWGLVDEVASKEATVQDLLSHRTGVPRHDAAIRRGDTDADILQKLRNLRPSAPFRDTWQYNNIMYKALAALVPTLLPSHQPFARYVKENVFDKLGLNSTTYAYDIANRTGELADPIGRDPAGGKVTPRTLSYWLPDCGEDGSNDAGDGGVISSAADLARWLQVLLLNGVNPETNESVIPADVVQKLATGVSVRYGAATFPEMSPTVYGAGQERGSYRGQEFIEHGGTNPGYISIIARYPNSNYGIAVLSNDNEFGGALVRIVQYYLTDRLFGLDQVDWNSRYQAIYLPPGHKPSPRPANATFPFGDIQGVEGMYNNDGYGKTEFCYVTPSTSSSMFTGASTSCNALRASISTLLPGIVTPDIPTFVASWNATSLSHIVLKHFDGDLFNLSVIQVQPTGISSNPYWAQDLGISALAQVDGDLDGIAFTGGIWGAGRGVRSPSGNTAKERAEVWFARIRNNGLNVQQQKQGVFVNEILG